MDGTNADDRKGGGKEQQTPRAPRSVREGMGGDRSRRRHGRRGRRGRHGAGSARKATPPRAAAPPPTPHARIATTTREVEVDGVVWTANVVGSGASPGGPDGSARMLEVTLEAEGEASPERTGYVAGVDLEGVDDDELVRLVRRLRREHAASGAPPSKRRTGKGRTTGHGS